MKCKHERVEVTLETQGRPVWVSNTEMSVKPFKNEDASREEWTGGLSYRCLNCGLYGRYSGSRVPKFLIRHLEQLPVWGEIQRSTLCASFTPLSVETEINEGKDITHA